MYSTDEAVITALATPAGTGAIALIRITGKDTFNLVQQCAQLMQKDLKIKDIPHHSIQLGFLTDELGTPIDQVFFSIMKAPKTFTGEDTVEITCHNNQLIIHAILTRLIAVGARLAQKGEFCKRAYLNGKIDLLQAEAINELIHAHTQDAIKLSLAQMKGTLSSWIYDIEKILVTAIAWCEASFEFLEEGGDFIKEINSLILLLQNKIDQIQKTFSAQIHIRQGLRIALWGPVNAGKSSLFNALLHKKRAIVSDQPGTTRDSIEAMMQKNNISWTLIDTAGIRNTDDKVEKEGIHNTYQEAHQADLILVCIDPTAPLDEKMMQEYKDLERIFSEKTIYVSTKSDLIDKICYTATQLITKKIYFVSSVTGEGIDQLMYILEIESEKLFSTQQSPFLINQRQFYLLEKLSNELGQIIPLCNASVQYEILSYHLKHALELVSELSGKQVNEKSLDTVFQQFCVGK